jgi:hypothetical protein
MTWYFDKRSDSRSCGKENPLNDSHGTGVKTKEKYSNMPRNDITNPIILHLVFFIRKPKTLG